MTVLSIMTSSLTTFQFTLSSPTTNLRLTTILNRIITSNPTSRHANSHHHTATIPAPRLITRHTTSSNARRNTHNNIHASPLLMTFLTKLTQRTTRSQVNTRRLNRNVNSILQPRQVNTPTLNRSNKQRRRHSSTKSSRPLKRPSLLQTLPPYTQRKLAKVWSQIF